MSKDATKRVEFLAKQFDIITEDEYDDILAALEENQDNFLVKSHSNDPLAVVYVTVKKDSEYEGLSVTTYKRSVRIYEDVFVTMVQADPTDNKIYLQWMLTVFTRQLKEGYISEAIRFAVEDLPLANDYLELFEGNKRKQLFKVLCKSNSELLNISDPTNINQYKSLSQVYDVIDPFIERDASSLERAMNTFVKAGQAEIPVRDRNFTLYIPLSVNASHILRDFTNWCTTPKGNGMFKEYTSKLTPFGDRSQLYVIIDNNLYDGTSDKLWQIHFETSQLMNRKDERENYFYDKVLAKSEALSNYFHNHLLTMARKEIEKSKNPNSSRYMKFLTEFGHPDALFEVLDDNVPALSFNSKCIIPKMPDISRFKMVTLMYFDSCRLREIDRGITGMKSLDTLSLPRNSIEAIPKFIGDCTSITSINLLGNKIKHIPSEISKLDPSNGGSLQRLSVSEEDIGEDNFKRLKELLPSVYVGKPMQQIFG